jgi:glutathione S-transferase
MNQPQYTLYVDKQFISPYAMSAFVALTEKKFAVGLQTVDLALRQNREAAYAGLSLTQRVPTLIDGDFRLSESTAIAEYLEQCFPAPDHAPLYPAAPQQRAKAREIQAWLRSDLASIRQERPTEVVFFSERRAPLSDEGQLAAAKLVAACNTLLRDGAEYLFEHWCIADTDLGLMLNRLARNGDALPPKLAAYAERQWQRPAVQQWLQLVHQAQQAEH